MWSSLYIELTTPVRLQDFLFINIIGIIPLFGSTNIQLFRTMAATIPLIYNTLYLILVTGENDEIAPWLKTEDHTNYIINSRTLYTEI